MKNKKIDHVKQPNFTLMNSTTLGESGIPANVVKCIKVILQHWERVVSQQMPQPPDVGRV